MVNSQNCYNGKPDTKYIETLCTIVNTSDGEFCGKNSCVRDNSSIMNVEFSWCRWVFFFLVLLLLLPEFVLNAIYTIRCVIHLLAGDSYCAVRIASDHFNGIDLYALHNIEMLKHSHTR